MPSEPVNYFEDGSRITCERAEHTRRHHQESEKELERGTRRDEKAGR